MDKIESAEAASEITRAESGAAESISIAEVNLQWPRVIREARAGKKFELTENGEITLELKPVVAPSPPPAAKPHGIKRGDMKGKIWIAPDFDEPLEEMKDYM